MPSSHLILCRPLLLLPSISPSIRVFSNESVLHIRWPKYWSFSFSLSPSNEYPGLISFRMDWLDLLAVQGTVKSLLQHHSSKAPILPLQDSPPYGHQPSRVSKDDKRTEAGSSLRRHLITVPSFSYWMLSHSLDQPTCSRQSGLHGGVTSRSQGLMRLIYMRPITTDGKESACNAGDPGSIPGSGRSPGEGNGYPLQHSCLEHPMDGGAWWATVHRVEKSRTRLSD